MKSRKMMAAVLACALLLLSAGCGAEETAVYVQSVDRLQAMTGIAPGDRFQGMVVSEDTAQIEKDPEMTVDELLVKEGDDVTEGQNLFTYDTQQLQLTLDKQQLELDQLLATIENYNQQIKDLEAERAQASNKLEYTLQIQSTQLDLKEAQINLTAKEEAVQASAQLLENAAVTSPVTGRVQSIHENGADQYGNPTAYITIQKTGTYRIKGILGELQRGAITEGTRMEAVSRTDETQVWAGTVSLVDYESPSQGNQNQMYVGMNTDEMSTASKYPFYVELDDPTGLLLGQHLYLQLEGQEEAPAGISIQEGFVCYHEDGSAYVWLDKGGRLKMQPVQVHEVDPMTGAAIISGGLTTDDYIAFPDAELCVDGAPTTRTEPIAESGV